MALLGALVRVFVGIHGKTLKNWTYVLLRTLTPHLDVVWQSMYDSIHMQGIDGVR